MKQEDIDPSKIYLATNEPQTKELFTGGDWKFDGIECVYSESGLIIADIRPCNHEGEELDSIFNTNKEEAEYNAALIAQAPAMYRALQKCIVGIIGLLPEKIAIDNPIQTTAYYAYHEAKEILKKANPKQ